MSSPQPIQLGICGSDPTHSIRLYCTLTCRATMGHIKNHPLCSILPELYKSEGLMNCQYAVYYWSLRLVINFMRIPDLSHKEGLEPHPTVNNSITELAVRRRSGRVIYHSKALFKANPTQKTASYDSQPIPRTLQINIHYPYFWILLSGGYFALLPVAYIVDRVRVMSPGRPQGLG